MKGWLIQWSIWILIGVVTAVLGIALVAVGSSLWLASAPLIDTASLLPPIAISAGVLIAILTFIRDRDKLARERAEARSRVFLSQAKAGLEEVLELLQDKNNNRVVWIRAARVLLEATALGRRIVAPEYINAYRLYEDKMRSQLYRALTLYNGETQERESLPPQFFYGIHNWQRNITLDRAALEASALARASSLTIDRIAPEPQLKQLAEESVVAIFNFLEYPKDYADPLKAVQLWESDWEEHVFGPDQGARRYVAHASSRIAIGGKIVKRQKSPAK